jgi:hypothetical protein
VAIAAGLVVLLAGLSLVGSVGDVITGAPVTAAGRFFELVMMTAATIAGVALVLHLASRLGAPFVAIGADAPPALAELPARVAFGAASAAAYAWPATRNVPRRWQRRSAVRQARSPFF